MSSEVVMLLRDLGSQGDLANAVIPPALYDQLRRMARSLLRNQRQGHTLQATALVNEAYLKVSGDAGPVFLDRSHFLAVMSRVMRHVLVDYARAQSAAKRGGVKPLSLHDHHAASVEDPAAQARLLDLNLAMDRLSAENAALARMVEMHYFGGMTAEEIAAVVPQSAHAVRHDLRAARAWLRRALAVPE